jgi:pseudolysin
MQNQHVRVVDMDSEYSGLGQWASFDCAPVQTAYWTGVNQDGYDAANGAYSLWNDALYIGTVVYDMYTNWYGVNALGSAQSPKLLTMRVHYGKKYENAFWDGKQMSFGDGGEMLYPLVALSVGAHEVSHGFTEQYSNLNYVDQSGGINEAFSDMASQAAEYFVESKNSWMIGSEIMKEKSKIRALRYMDYPIRDGKSIAHVSQYHKGIDVHHLSGVYNRFFYLLATHSGWNTRLAFHVMVKANMDYWVPTTNFSTGACGVLWAADDLDLSLSAIEESFAEVGINTDQC